MGTTLTERKALRLDMDVVELIDKRAANVGAANFSEYVRVAVESFAGITPERYEKILEERQRHAEILADLARQVARMDDTEEVLKNILAVNKRGAA